MKIFFPLRPGREAVITFAADQGGGPLGGPLSAEELLLTLRALRELGKIGEATCRLSTETTLIEER